MESVDIQILSMDNHRIDGTVGEDNGVLWRLTGVYGWFETNQKCRTWEMINWLGRDNRLPWLLGGDFNKILQESEKRGGVSCDFNNICDFRDCLDQNSLKELDFVGSPFTWRKNKTTGLIVEKLDRFVANGAWSVLLPLAVSEIISWDGSDHTPIIVHMKGFMEEGEYHSNDSSKPFRFEPRWTHHDEFEASIRNLILQKSGSVGCGARWLRIVALV